MERGHPTLRTREDTVMVLHMLCVVTGVRAALDIR